MKNNTELTLAVLMQPNQANYRGFVHGGEIMKLMDNAAGALAISYAKGNVVTARVDQLQFLQPVHIGSFVTCNAKLAYVGSSSMEIIVKVDVESLTESEKPKRAIEAFFTLVAIDEEGVPRPIKPYTPKTKEELRLYEIVKGRRDKQRKIHEENKIK